MHTYLSIHIYTYICQSLAFRLFPWFVVSLVKPWGQGRNERLMEGDLFTLPVESPSVDILCYWLHPYRVNSTVIWNNVLQKLLLGNIMQCKLILWEKWEMGTPLKNITDTVRGGGRRGETSRTEGQSLVRWLRNTEMLNKAVILLAGCLRREMLAVWASDWFWWTRPRASWDLRGSCNTSGAAEALHNRQRPKNEHTVFLHGLS